ncbi:GntT/GntP/DsdX family permease [Aurantiacibacter spongiae]|uniref:Gluconate transporter n=1 Tax=Aurantiacibacter spongiae TaxID=2488860 RepID=A0A3N5DBL4_9SPHN|nr:gluconate:H+ symporter [Aurantiacibacter spongiae]RPF72158.1 gluconate transporter [Aurantiacibacter spongiae]
MSEPWASLSVVAVSIVVLIAMVLRWKVPAFIALLVVALGTGIAFGAPPADVIAAVRKGTGEALGFVAVVIGLGAMLGGLLEASGGIGVLANRLLDAFGERRAPWALVVIGTLVGIPLFFDVGFIVLAPLVVTLSLRARRRVMYFALPLLAGLLTMHALLPPHPGPVAVAELIGTDYGLLALYGLACGIPAAVIAGPVFAVLAHGQSGFGEGGPPPRFDENAPAIAAIGFVPALGGMLIPLSLILLAALAGGVLPQGPSRSFLEFIGHPFTALILACAFVGLWLRLRLDAPLQTISDVMTRALAPAGLMVLVVGAGAAYKEVLIQSGAGEQITAAVSAFALAVPVFAFLLAAFVRVAQGSATVAMVTAAGLAAPLIAQAGLSPGQVALVTVSIGAGASVASHVNDTGFWLVKQYLGLTETQTFRSWTLSATIAGFVMFAIAMLLWSFT